MTINFPGEFPSLETEHLLLRQLTTEDNKAVFNNFSDEDVVKYIMQPITTIEAADEFIKAFIDEFTRKEALTWGIVLKSDNACHGTCSLMIKPGMNAELGFDLAKTHWNKGLMSEAVRAVVDYGFRQIGLEKIEAHTLLLNSRSVHLLKRVKFQVDGVLRENCFFNGQFWDEIHFSLQNKDWT